MRLQMEFRVLYLLWTELAQSKRTSNSKNLMVCKLVQSLRFAHASCLMQVFADFVGSCPMGSGWSPYFDRPMQRPFGEIESKPRGQVCMEPTGAEARVVSSSISHFEARQDVILNPSRGLVCFNSKQTNKQCENYKVRFCCPRKLAFCYRLNLQLA